MPDLTKTRAGLVTEAAQCLLLVGSGQSLQAEDGSIIDGKVDALVARLFADGVVDIANIEEIPVEYFDALAELLGNSCASKFGIAFSPEKQRVFEAQLRRTASARPTYETLRSDYF